MHIQMGAQIGNLVFGKDITLFIGHNEKQSESCTLYLHENIRNLYL